MNDHKIKSLIAYLRLSKEKKSKDGQTVVVGLGIDAQRAKVDELARQLKATIIQYYTEIETGRKNDRPQLLLAMAHAKRMNATLVVARLDRLTRNARFLLTIIEDSVDVIFADFPTIPPGPMGKFFLTNLAAMAEMERAMISQRTLEALAALKARGVALGSARPDHWKGREHLRLAGLAKGRAVAASLVDGATREAYADLLPMMKRLRVGGSPLREIAGILNNDGLLTRRGKLWTATQVARVLGEL